MLGVGDAVGYSFRGARTLNVVKGILTDSVRVSPVAQWADFVFDENYTLTPLSDLDNYIKTNKHLPAIPAAKEVAANGIELGEMNAKLLQKVEELTLYLIDQQKQIVAVQAELTALKKKLENL